MTIAREYCWHAARGHRPHEIVRPDRARGAVRYRGEPLTPASRVSPLFYLPAGRGVASDNLEEIFLALA
jgi:hypothetical protein